MVETTGRTTLLDGLAHLRRTALQPPEVVAGSAWAEAHVPLQVETSAEPGPWTLYGYQREILDAICDPAVREIVVPKGARVGWTQMLTAAIAYFVAHEASSVLMVRPTERDAQQWAEDNWKPLLADVPILGAMRRPAERGETQDKWSDYGFLNGSVVKVRSAASDDAFRSLTIRVLMGDEIDAEAWLPTAGDRGQGDKLDLLRRRAATFYNAKLLLGSTPTHRETSLAWKTWLLSDQRRFFVPCPHCQGRQFLRWPRFKWTADDGRVTACWYECEHCDRRIDEHPWKAWMDARGEWAATATAKRPGLRGYHIWAGMSLHPGAGWVQLAQEFLEAKAEGPEKLKPFINTQLGEPWDEQTGPSASADGLAARLEPYPAEVPDGVVGLTAGVDVQTGKKSDGLEERLEVSVWGFGRRGESWLIGHYVIPGEPLSPESEAALDELLDRRWKGQDGREFVIQATAIDLGGHFTDRVKDYCRTRAKKNRWAVKGRNSKLGTRSGSVWPRKASRKDGDTWYMLDTQLCKDILDRKLRVEPAPGAAHVHLPLAVPDAYLDGLTAERVKISRSGARHWEPKKKGAYAEPWDCAVYATAALFGLQATSAKFRDMSKLADALGIPHPEPYSGPDLSAQAVERAVAHGESVQRGQRVDASPDAGRPNGAAPSQAPAPSSAAAATPRVARPQTAGAEARRPRLAPGSVILSPFMRR